jgi:hypothetical protein
VPPFDALHVDGIYGSLTQESVEDAQQYYGAHVDGVFGPQTSSHMSWPLAGTPGVCGFWSWVRHAIDTGNAGYVSPGPAAARPGGPATTGELSLSLFGPTEGLAVDAAGNLLIPDGGNSRVRSVTG